MASRPPKLRSAARRASRGSIPLRRLSSACISRWKWISSSSSRSRRPRKNTARRRDARRARLIRSLSFGNLQEHTRSPIGKQHEATSGFGRSLGAGRRRGRPWIVGPWMLRVAAAKLLSHLRVRAVPETSQIPRALNGPAIGCQEREDERLAPPADARRFGQTEELLQLDGRRDAAVLAVLEPHGAAAWHLQDKRRPAIEITHQVRPERGFNRRLM